MAEGTRQRGKTTPRTLSGGRELSFSNPYPWMSSIEAMVHLALEEHTVPFSWRYFDGYAPNFTQMLVNTGYQPEFTLTEYKAVILVTGGFYGTLPGVLDKLALAMVTLEHDGWKVVNLFDVDIRAKGAWNLLIKDIPTLGSIKGAPKVNPYGRPDLMSGLRNRVIRRGINPQLDPGKVRDRGSNGERRRVRRGSRSAGDNGRVRIGQSGAVSGRYKAR